MKYTPRSREVRERILEIRDENPKLPFSKVAAQVSEEFSLSGENELTTDAAKCYYRRQRRLDKALNEPEGRETPLVEQEDADSADLIDFGGTVDEFRELFGDTWKYQERELPRPADKRRVCAIGDCHGNPSPELIQKIIDLHPTDIIFGGDQTDSREISPHRKNSGPWSSKVKALRARKMGKEIKIMRAAGQHLLDNTQARQWWMYGNHDVWAWRYYLDVIEQLAPKWMIKFQDPLEIILRRLPKDRCKIAGTRLKWHTPAGDQTDQGATEFLFPFGDALFSHMDFARRQPGMAVAELSKWVEDWRLPMGWPDFSLLCQFHGHKVALYEDKGGWRTCVEPGMGGLPIVESYKTIYKGNWRPGSMGFLYFEQHRNERDKWITDTGSAQIIRPNHWPAAQERTGFGSSTMDTIWRTA